MRRLGGLAGVVPCPHGPRWVARVAGAV